MGRPWGQRRRVAPARVRAHVLGPRGHRRHTQRLRFCLTRGIRADPAFPGRTPARVPRALYALDRVEQSAAHAAALRAESCGGKRRDHFNRHDQHFQGG